MGFVDAFLLIGLFLAALPIAIGVGFVCRRILHAPRLAGCLPPLVLLTALFAVPLALRVAGVHGTARVAERRESVKVFGYTGSSFITYNLVLHFRPAGASLADATSRIVSTDSLTLGANATRDVFDRTRVGDVVDVVYLPFRPSIGKLADRSFLDLVWAMLEIPEVPFGLAVLLAVAVAVVLSRRTIVRPAVRRARVMVMAACFVVAVGAGWMSYQNPRPVPESAVDASAVARVVGVQRIDRTLFSFDNTTEHSSDALAQPFDVVEVEFTPAALGQPVHGTDAVDSGSVRGLDVGAPLAIRYATANARTVRIVGGTRTFRARNARGMLEQVAILGGMLLVLVLFWALVQRRRQRPLGAG